MSITDKLKKLAKKEGRREIFLFPFKYIPTEDVILERLTLRELNIDVREHCCSISCNLCGLTDYKNCDKKIPYKMN